MTTASGIGTVALIDVGTEIFSSTLRGPDEEAIGGVVLAKGAFSDTDAEVHDTYLVLDPYRTRTLNFHNIADHDVDRERIVVPDGNDTRLRFLVRRLCEEVAFKAPGKRRSGTMDARQAELVAYAFKLTTVLFAGQKLAS